MVHAKEQKQGTESRFFWYKVSLKIVMYSHTLPEDLRNQLETFISTRSAQVQLSDSNLSEAVEARVQMIKLEVLIW